MNETALLVKEHCPNLYAQRRLQIDHAPDLRPFSSQWAKTVAKQTSETNWMELWTEIEELFSLGEEDGVTDDRRLYETVMAYIEDPTVGNYREIAKQHYNLSDWSVRYPLLSYVLFDDDRTRMIGVQAAHPSLNLLLSNVPTSSEPPQSFYINKEVQSAYIPSRLHLWSRLSQEEKRSPLSLPSTWDRILLAQYVQGPRLDHSDEHEQQLEKDRLTTWIVLDSVTVDEFNRYLDSIWIYNEILFEYAINMGMTVSELSLLATEADYLPVIIAQIEDLIDDSIRDPIPLLLYYEEILKNSTRASTFEAVLSTVMRLVIDDDLLDEMEETMWDYLTTPGRMRYIDSQIILALKHLQGRGNADLRVGTKEIKAIAREFGDMQLIAAYDEVGRVFDNEDRDIWDDRNTSDRFSDSDDGPYDREFWGRHW